MKFSLKHGFSKVTPAAVRRWATAGFTAAGSVATWQGIAGNTKLATAVCIFAFATKLLSEGFYEENASAN